jgi:hypothetical protein
MEPLPEKQPKAKIKHLGYLYFCFLSILIIAIQKFVTKGA